MLLIVGMKGQEADHIPTKKEDRNTQIKTMADLNKGQNRGQEINIKRNKDIKEMIEIVIEIVTETKIEIDMIIEIAKEMDRDKEEEVKAMTAIVKAEETEIESTKSPKKIPISSKENKSKE